MELQSLPNVLQSIGQLLPKEAALTVADDSRFIYYKPSDKINVPIEPGIELKEGTVSLQTLKNKHQISKMVDKHVFGTPYYGIGYPIMENGEVKGVVTAIFPPQIKGIDNRTARHPFLIGKTEDRWLPIAHQDIHFINSENGKTFLHTKKGIYQNKYNLTELEQMLPTDEFIRCHRAYIVRMDSIEEIHPHFHSTFMLQMKGEERMRIPVSQKYASIFRQWLGF